jgi:hypothetical protein
MMRGRRKRGEGEEGWKKEGGKGKKGRIGRKSLFMKVLNR